LLTFPQNTRLLTKKKKQKESFYNNNNLYYFVEANLKAMTYWIGTYIIQPLKVMSLRGAARAKEHSGDVAISSLCLCDMQSRGA